MESTFRTLCQGQGSSVLWLAKLVLLSQSQYRAAWLVPERRPNGRTFSTYICIFFSGMWMFWWKNKSIWICFMRCGINLPYSLPRPGQGYWKVHWLALWMPNDTERIGKLNIYAMFLYAPQLQLPYEFWNAKLLPTACNFIQLSAVKFIWFPSHTTYSWKIMCQKCEGICGLWNDIKRICWKYERNRGSRLGVTW